MHNCAVVFTGCMKASDSCVRTQLSDACIIKCNNNNYAARAYNFAFTNNNLVLYSDTGIITIYSF